MLHKIKIFATLVFLSGYVYSQQQTSSPYSEFGYGDVYSNSLYSRTGTGGAGIASNHPFSISFLNPAGHASVQKERFIFETGVGYSQRILQKNNVSSLTNTTGVEYFAFSFPVISEKWSSSIGILPFSSVGYDINISATEYTSHSYGSGGINQVVWGNAFKPFDFLSVGFHARYVFGETYRKNIITFPNNPYSFSAEKRDIVKTNGIIWDFGFLYTYTISEKSSLQIGATYRDKQTVAYTQNTFLASFQSIGDQPDIYIDTLDNTFVDDKRTDLPQKIGFGIGYSVKEKMQILFDFDTDNWDRIFVYGETNNQLQRVNSYRLGVEYIPNIRSMSYFQRLPYRFGVNITQLPIYKMESSGVVSPIDVSVSFGTDFIFRNTSNNISPTFVIGKRQDFSNEHAMSELFFMGKLTVRLHEHWFFQRKID